MIQYIMNHTKTTERVVNFNAGPSTLPLEVLEKAQAEFTNYQGKGLSVLEMSHRSGDFMAIRDQAESAIRQLLSISDAYTVLFLQGGATTQFSSVPMYFGQTGPVSFIHTGSWTKKALAEIKKFGQHTLLASSEDTNFDRIPSIDTSAIDPNSSYVYCCSNNTIYGTQFQEFPDTGAVPLVADMSSDILSRPLNIDQFGLIFAGAQKNAGPAGVTVVIARKDWIAANANPNLPLMFQYDKHMKEDSMLNTCPTFPIYLLGLTAQWLLDQGGVAAIEARNQAKAHALYNYIDANDFYTACVNGSSRSLMNVCFKTPSESLDTEFHKRAAEAGFIGLKGHRLVGGLRASIYNAMPSAGVDQLIGFMDEFRKR